MSASKARKIVELYREIEKRDSEIALLRANLELQQKSYEREIVLEVAAERERCAKLCDDEARIRKEAGEQHPEESDSRGRCFAAARAAMNCASGVRSGEVA